MAMMGSNRQIPPSREATGLSNHTSIMARMISNIATNQLNPQIRASWQIKGECEVARVGDLIKEAVSCELNKDSHWEAGELICDQAEVVIVDSFV